MSNTWRSTGANNGGPERTYFEQQREALVNDIAMNMEHVLQNINKLNRSLEGIIAVGHEFGQVEGLWSQFENVMAKHEETKDDNGETETQSQEAH